MRGSEERNSAQLLSYKGEGKKKEKTAQRLRTKKKKRIFFIGREEKSIAIHRRGEKERDGAVDLLSGKEGMTGKIARLSHRSDPFFFSKEEEGEG